MRNTPDKSELFQKEIAQARKELQEGTIDKEQCERACLQAYTRLNGAVPPGYDLVVHFQDDNVVLGLVNKGGQEDNGGSTTTDRQSKKGGMQRPPPPPPENAPTGILDPPFLFDHPREAGWCGFQSLW